MSRQGAGTSVPAPLAYPAACWAGLLGVPVGGGPPASRPRCELRSARRLEAWPGSAAAHRHRDQAPSPPAGVAAWPSGPSGALHTGGAVSLTCACASARCPARPRHCPLISHVIPLRRVQSLNLHRWNCNVFGVSRKMTTKNYVRNLGGGGAWSLICGSARRIEARPGPAAAHGHRSRVPLLPVGVTGVSRVEFLGCSGACCYKRRQSKVFFVWISVPLLQTSSIRGLFRRKWWFLGLD